MSEVISAQAYREFVAALADREASKRKRNKFGAIPMVVDGRRFASRMEARRYSQLVLLQKAGAITSLQCQPRFVVSSPAVDPPVVYIADFRYRERGADVVEDVKGAETKEYKIKRRLFRAAFPAIDFREIRKGKSR